METDRTILESTPHPSYTACENTSCESDRAQLPPQRLLARYWRLEVGHDVCVWERLTKQKKYLLLQRRAFHRACSAAFITHWLGDSIVGCSSGHPDLRMVNTEVRPCMTEIYLHI